MLDVKKLKTRIKLEIILLWIESLQKKNKYSDKEKEFVSLVCDHILEEVSK